MSISLTGFEAKLLAVVVGAFVRVEGKEIVAPELGHAQPPPAPET